MATPLTLGRRVERGDVLVELESETERLQVEEEKARLGAFTSRREALRGQIAAEERAWPDEQKTASLAVAEARARQREADAAAQFAQTDAARIKRLRDDKLVAEAEWQRADTTAQKQRAAAAVSGVTVNKLESEAQSKDRTHEVRLAQLEGDMATSAATVKRHEYQLEQRRIKAPVAGQLGEVAPLRVGGIPERG